jgi:hypothetical protein
MMALRLREGTLTSYPMRGSAGGGKAQPELQGIAIDIFGVLHKAAQYEFP